jgi:hypothetical protein
MCDAALATLKTRDDESMICVFLYFEKRVISATMLCVLREKKNSADRSHVFCESCGLLKIKSCTASIHVAVERSLRRSNRQKSGTGLE